MLNRVIRKVKSIYLHSRIKPYAKPPGIAANMEVLKPYYDKYIANVSVANMAASLELSATMLSILQSNNYKKLVDLGSGFSSFVLRYYAKSTPGVQVYSVDDDAAWLDKTRSYLRSNNVSDTDIYTLDEFLNKNLSDFDCILHDLNFVEIRINYVKSLLSKLSGKGILVLDDMHKPDYRLEVLSKLRNEQVDILDLRPYTLDSFGRYAMIAKRA